MADLVPSHPIGADVSFLSAVLPERRRRITDAFAIPAPALTDLPAWPVIALFAGYGVWWALGLGAFAVPIMGLVMGALLVVRRGVLMPRGFALWAIFLAFAIGAAVELGLTVRLIGFGVRVSNYVGASLIFLYIYNAPRRLLGDRVVMLSMVGFFATVVAGGWLGVLVPDGQLVTPTQALLPHSIASNSYVQALVHPSFAEVQKPWGSPVAFVRPSAPFPYTNGWGCNLSLLVPFVIVAISKTRGGMRHVIEALLVLALVPAFATLNRGMFIAVGFSLIYVAIRYACRGRVGPLLGLVLGLVVVLTFAIASGAVADLTSRLEYSQTNYGRSTIYNEAFQGAVASPVFGNGAPKPSAVLDISIGTQGQFWTVLFSYGFIALGAYMGWFAYLAFRSRKATTNTIMWMHVVCLIALLTCFYYGYDGPQLALAMVAGAVALRPPDPVITR